MKARLPFGIAHIIAGVACYPDKVQEIRDRLKSAKSIGVMTGAGISAESGIPTFRGSGGLWKQFRAEDLATPQAFQRDPKQVWDWYDWRRTLIAQAQPNPGHRALAELERRAARFTLITQNVDDLHERGGSHAVLHVHGSIWKTRCLGCGMEDLDMRAPLPEIPPRCPHCRDLVRPGVVWFGESLPQDVWRQAQAAASNADVFLVVGTSAMVYPAAGLAHAAKARGADIIEVNLDKTDLSGEADWFLRGPSGEILPQLLAEIL